MRGLLETLYHEGLKGTFYRIPSELQTHRAILLDLEKRGHEIGLHLHPADQGYEESLGIYGPDARDRLGGH